MKKIKNMSDSDFFNEVTVKFNEFQSNQDDCTLLTAQMISLSDYGRTASNVFYSLINNMESDCTYIRGKEFNDGYGSAIIMFMELCETEFYLKIIDNQSDLIELTFLLKGEISKREKYASVITDVIDYIGYHSL